MVDSTSSQNLDEKRDEGDDVKKTGKSDDKKKQNKDKLLDGRSRQRDYFKEELIRIRESLQREASKIKIPLKKKYTPDTFNALTPYFNVHTVEYVMSMPSEFQHGYVSRKTAIGLTEPAMDHRMDIELLPKISPRPIHIEEKSPRRARSNKAPKEGSTHLPKFPAVCIALEDLHKRTLYYSDVPMLRDELEKKYRSSTSDKFAADYKRTKQDFHRMDLSLIEAYHPISRPSMRAAYFAYLQNNGGSRQAVYECVRNAEKRIEADRLRTRQVGTPRRQVTPRTAVA